MEKKDNIIKIVCALIGSPVYSPAISDEDVEKNDKGALVKIDTNYYKSFEPRNQAHRGRQRYDCSNPEKMYVRDAISMHKMIEDACQ